MTVPAGGAGVPHPAADASAHRYQQHHRRAGADSCRRRKAVACCGVVWGWDQPGAELRADSRVGHRRRRGGHGGGQGGRGAGGVLLGCQGLERQAVPVGPRACQDAWRTAGVCGERALPGGRAVIPDECVRCGAACAICPGRLRATSPRSPRNRP